MLKALYGLDALPASRSCYRDEELAALRWIFENELYQLLRCTTDTFLWRVVKVAEAGLDHPLLWGLVGSYVGDFFFTAFATMCATILETIKKKWHTSPPLSAVDGLTFLGINIKQCPNRIHLSQANYVKELLLRHEGVQGAANTPALPCSNEVEEPETPNLASVRVARGLVWGIDLAFYQVPC